MPISATPFEFDTSNKVHAKALGRLETEQIGWLGSIGRNGYPHAVPVWFLWFDGAVIVFSQPGAAKVRNLRANPSALFHLEAGDDGEQLMVLQGAAELSAEPTAAWFERVGVEYLEKYGAGITALGSNPEEFVGAYSVAIVVRPEKLIAW